GELMARGPPMAYACRTSGPLSQRDVNRPPAVAAGHTLGSLSMDDTPLPADLFVALAHPFVALTIGLFFFGVGLARRENGFLAMAGACIPFSAGLFIQISGTGVIPIPISILVTGVLYTLAALSFYLALLHACRGQ